MLLNQDKNKLNEKWKPIMESEGVDIVINAHKAATTIQVLENTLYELHEAAPTNSTGAGIDNWNPILISMVRRVMPKSIGFDVCGVQAMKGPTGLIFAMKSRYVSQSGAEAGGQTEPDTDFSGKGTHVPTDDTNNPWAGVWTTGEGMSTAEAEALGSSGSPAFAEMAFSIEQASVTAKSRALKAEYSIEMAQDLKTVHNLDAETELANILAPEILNEQNREIVRTILKIAKQGAQKNTATKGVYDLDVDAGGRWSVEKYKGLMFALEREANAVARETRRGRGNFIICSADVASALSIAGLLDTAPALKDNLKVDEMGNTFVGVLNGKYKVFVDPYWEIDTFEYAVMGYKGSNQYDAGMFYCPYAPLQMMKAVGENTFQPKIGFKTRYAIAPNPFTTLGADSNVYYRKLKITNLL